MEAVDGNFVESFSLNGEKFRIIEWMVNCNVDTGNVPDIPETPAFTVKERCLVVDAVKVKGDEGCVGEAGETGECLSALFLLCLIE